jgi:L-malate glycosyltransferase
VNSGDGPLRICHLASGDLWGGAEVMLFELLRELHGCSGLQVRAILLNRGRLARELVASRMAVSIIDEGAHSLPSLVREIRRELAGNPADIVHAHRYKENLLAWLCGGRALRLATQHGLPESQIGTGPRLKQWLNFQLLGRVFSQVVAVSGELGHRLRHDWQIPAARLSVIPNGVRMPEPQSRHERARAPGRPLVVGSAGRLVAVKDYSLLVETAALLRRSGEPVHFLLAGDGPLCTELQGLIVQHGLEKDFRLLGEVAEMEPFYRELDIYISTSRHEGLPMSILEAMSYALPVVAPAVGGIGEVVRHQREGLLVDGRDPATFAHACRRMLNDPTLRRRAGEAGRQRVLAAYSTRRMAESYRQLYGQLILDPFQPPLASRGGAHRFPPEN